MNSLNLVASNYVSAINLEDDKELSDEEDVFNIRQCNTIDGVHIDISALSNNVTANHLTSIGNLIQQNISLIMERIVAGLGIVITTVSNQNIINTNLLK